eukprot:scaffold4412_cov401-Prasinococcus_capsulatus_cf.AAC.13
MLWPNAEKKLSSCRRCDCVSRAQAAAERRSELVKPSSTVPAVAVRSPNHGTPILRPRGAQRSSLLLTQSQASLPGPGAPQALAAPSPTRPMPHSPARWAYLPSRRRDPSTRPAPGSAQPYM